MLNTTSINPNDLLPIFEVMYDLKKPLFLWGAPGNSKSSIVKQFAVSKGLRLIDLRLSQLAPEDLRGLPYLNKETQKTIWYTPDLFPTEGKGIIFLDELNRAEPVVQGAAFELILDRRVGPYQVPDGWVIWAAGNTEESDFSCVQISPALSDRFTHFKVEVSPEEWIKWGSENNIHSSVLSFIKIKPDYLNGTQLSLNKETNLGSSVYIGEEVIKPTPRSWENVSDFMKTKLGGMPLEYLIKGRIGEAACTEFLYVLEEINNLPNVDELMKKDNKSILSSLKSINSLASLYGLVYGIIAYINDLDKYKKATEIFNILGDIQDTLPRAEIQTLGMDLLLGKLRKNSFSIIKKYMECNEYQVYQQSLNQFSTK